MNIICWIPIFEELVVTRESKIPMHNDYKFSIGSDADYGKSQNQISMKMQVFPILETWYPRK